MSGLSEQASASAYCPAIVLSGESDPPGLFHSFFITDVAENHSMPCGASETHLSRPKRIDLLTTARFPLLARLFLSRFQKVNLLYFWVLLAAANGGFPFVFSLKPHKKGYRVRGSKRNSPRYTAEVHCTLNSTNWREFGVQKVALLATGAIYGSYGQHLGKGTDRWCYTDGNGFWAVPDFF